MVVSLINFSTAEMLIFALLKTRLGLSHADTFSFLIFAKTAMYWG